MEVRLFAADESELALHQHLWQRLRLQAKSCNNKKGLLSKDLRLASTGRRRARHEDSYGTADGGPTKQACVEPIPDDHQPDGPRSPVPARAACISQLRLLKLTSIHDRHSQMAKTTVFISHDPGRKPYQPRTATTFFLSAASYHHGSFTSRCGTAATRSPTTSMITNVSCASSDFAWLAECLVDHGA